MRNKVIQLDQYCMQVVIGHTMELDEFSTWYWSYPQSFEILIPKTPKKVLQQLWSLLFGNSISFACIHLVIFQFFFWNGHFNFCALCLAKKKVPWIMLCYLQCWRSMCRLNVARIVPQVLLIWKSSIWFLDFIQMIITTSHNDL